METNEQRLERLKKRLLELDPSFEFTQCPGEIIHMVFADPNGVSAYPGDLIRFEPDGKIAIWSESYPIDSTDELVDMEPEETTEDEIVEGIRHVRVQCALGGESWTAEDIVSYMMSLGWEIADDGRRIWHRDDHEKVFDTWFEAAKACIRVGTGI
jgi:hypothetical protein